MAQLKQLEKAVEASIAEGKLDNHEATIDEFLNANGSISVSSSSKLHDALYRIWTSDEVQKVKKAAPVKDQEPNAIEGTPLDLTPVTSGALDPVSLARSNELMNSVDPRVIFLEILNRLGPCLIDKEQLNIWWKELSYYAIDSTGYRLDLVEQSKKFISGVLTGSFYEYGESSNAELYSELSCSFGRNALRFYLSDNIPIKTEDGGLTDERIRFVRQNCRVLFGQFARKETKCAFIIINEYFVQPRYRIDILDFVVEYLAQSQNSKLFRIYETPFFESLLKCLEQDRARPAVQLAVTALSMFLVHICDKLVTADLLYRIYGCFGRVCSWQPGRAPQNISKEATPESEVSSESDLSTKLTLDASSPTAPSGGKAYDDKNNDNDTNDDNTSGKPPTDVAPTTSGDNHEHKKHEQSSSTGWEVLDDISPEAGDASLDAEPETLDVIPLFTFLYGLFPINTLQFCRQCDEYFAKHNYQKRITDLWSRFMVTRKAEEMVRQFRVDPLLVKLTEDAEFANAITRFQEVGSALGLTSICTSRRIVDVCTLHDHGNPDESSEEVRDNENIQHLLNDHRQAFQMHPEGTAGHWHRELLLIRNELAFANFSRDMSEQRALRWQKRASNRSVVEIKNDELERQNNSLRLKVGSLESEALRAVRSARTIMRERSAYETTILDKNKEFREKVRTLETKLMEAEKDALSAQHEAKEAQKLALENQNKVSDAEAQLKAVRNHLEPDSHEETSLRAGEQLDVESVENKTKTAKLENEVETLQYTIEKMKEDHNVSIRQLQAEILNNQAEFANARLKMARPPVVENRDQQNGPASSVSLDSVIKEKNSVISRLQLHNDDLSRRCAALEHELRARKVHEEERLNELQAALLSSRPYASQESVMDNRFRGRGGAQGVPRRVYGSG